MLQGIIEEGKVNSFNIPVYYPHPSEVKSEILNQGSFDIDQLDVSQVNFYELDNAFNTAQCTRAVAEPLLISHFGESVTKECGVVLIFVFGTTLFDFPSCCGILQFILKDLHQTIADSINDLCVNVAEPEA
ncbi:hypothetical protein TSUD_211590 [Trifolium subterraneum]|uniref:Uncharacterized protein n=1 Tax=Trifolium subterraneum TaxID=3900 RepID=A0A2Z6MX65_TRISU|nr:hypothetical protein TSUD_211590 [Trifolium subterraneum]